MPIVTLPFQTSVVYSEKHGSREETFSADGQAGALVLKCPWADRRTLARDVIGYTETFGPDDGVRYLPMRLPGAAGVFAVKATITPLGKVLPDGANTRVASYTDAEISVEFAFAESDPSTGDRPTIGSESIDGAAEFLRLSSERLYWDDAQTEPVEDAAAPGKIVRMLDWVITIDEIETLPSGLLSFEGTVNSAPITSNRLATTFEPETLLFQTPRMRRQLNADGAAAWSLELRLTHRATGWNRFYRPSLDVADAGVWTPKPMFDEHGNLLKAYPAANFAPLMGYLL